MTVVCQVLSYLHALPSLLPLPNGFKKEQEGIIDQGNVKASVFNPGPDV